MESPIDKKKPYSQVVAERLLDQLKAGTAPWQRPWAPGEPSAMLPYNPSTGKRYRGVNALMLMSQDRTDQRWMTYKQAAAAGAQVRKGEKGTPVQYWKFTDEHTKTDENGNPELDAEGKPIKYQAELVKPRVFFAVVFNGEQIDGLPPLDKKLPQWNPHERAEAILANSGADIRHMPSDRAFYRPATDSITLPERSQFPTADNYYATALHELNHWTGHSARLDRDLSHPFGSQGYAKEELRAEIASMILGDTLGIGHDPSQHVAYVKSWIKALEDDPKEIFRACNDAEKIHDYVLGLEQKQKITEAERLANLVDPALLAVDVKTVLEDPDHTYRHFVNYTGAGQGQTLDQALRTHGLATIGAVTGTDSRAFYQRAHDALSPMFGIEPGFDQVTGAYLERKGLAQAFQVAAEKLVATNREQQEATVELAASARAALTAADEVFQAELERVYGRQAGDMRYQRKFDDPALEAARQNYQQAGDAWHAAVRHARQSETLAAVTSDPDIQRRAAEQARTYITVPFAQKDEAKALGAKWDRNGPGNGSWYIPPGVDAVPFAKWPVADAAAHPEQGREDKVRQYLAVPYAERQAAKAAGALWDAGAKSWYVGPKADLAKLERWVPSAGAEERPHMNPREEFAVALREAGFILNGQHPIMDGQRHRLPVEGGRKGNMDGFYVGHVDGHPAGRIINNRTGVDYNWKSKGYALTHEEKARLNAEAAQKLEDRAVAQRDAQERAAGRVAEQIRALSPVAGMTPYLERKGLLPTAGIYTDPLKEDKAETCIPAYDTTGKTWTMQYIQADGTKRFAKDARKEGCFHVIGGFDRLSKAAAIVIGEGYATAASIAEGLGKDRPLAQAAVVAAFDSGNLVHVAKALREKYPTTSIILAGDDDKHQETVRGHNPGRVKATEAAAAVGGKAIFPVFAPGEQAQHPKEFTDFNDLATKSRLGREGLERQVRSIVFAEIKHQVERQENRLSQGQDEQQPRRAARIG